MMENKENRKKVNFKMIITGCIILAVIVAAIVFSGKNEQPTDEETSRTVQAAELTIENTLSSDGEIISSAEENVSPYTSYYLNKIKVEEGDALAEGDTILTYTNGYKMTAPYNCVVEGWNLPDEEEQLTSDHYITIAGTDVMQMELSVGEEDISKVTAGDSALITVEATDGRYEGTVTYVSEVGNYSGGTSTFTVKVTFDNDGEVKLGMSGTASITLEKAENVIGVPVDAVTSRPDGSYVTIMEGDVTSEVNVETGISNDSYIEIKEGINAGDIIVVPISDEDSNEGESKGFGGGEMPGSGGGNRPDGGEPGGGMPGDGGGSRPDGGSSGGGAPGGGGN